MQLNEEYFEADYIYFSCSPSSQKAGYIIWSLVTPIKNGYEIIVKHTLEPSSYELIFKESDSNSIIKSRIVKTVKELELSISNFQKQDILKRQDIVLVKSLNPEKR